MYVWRKYKASVGQLLQLPGVAKMKAANTGAVGRHATADLPGWGSGMGVAH
jgi:hypothetical protein